MKPGFYWVHFKEDRDDYLHIGWTVGQYVVELGVNDYVEIIASDCPVHPDELIFGPEIPKYEG